MFQDDTPKKGHQRGLSEAPGLWRDAGLSSRATSVVTFATRLPLSSMRGAAVGELKILLAGEDDEAMASVAELLSRVGSGQYQITRLTHLPLSFGRGAAPWDAVLVACEPDLTQGLAAFAGLQAAGLSAPVVLVAAGIDDEAVDRAIDSGVAEVLEALDLDADALDRAIRTGIARHRRHARLQVEARRDDLTGLANRASFRDRLDHALTLARRGNGRVAVLMIDLDGFKAVNDRFGHPFGDELLKRVGERMRSRVRESDTVARLGGDEFGVLLPSLARHEDAAVVIRKLLEAIKPPIEVDGSSASITASIGVAVFPDHAGDAVSLNRLADAAMYLAKRSGGHRCCWHGDSRPRVGPEAEELAEAFVGGGIAVAIRPQIALKPGGPVLGLRPLWHHARCGVLDLLALRTLVEEAGLIDLLTERLLRTAADHLKSWQSGGHASVALALPMLSRRPLAWGGLAEQVAVCAARHGLAPGRLHIEVDEQLLVDDLLAGGHGTTALRQAGVNIAIDRFGSGAAASGLLTRFRPVALRLCEGALDPDGGPDRLFLFQSATMLARRLGVRVVAVGADAPDRLALARTIGVDAVESTIGYAATAEACLPWLRIAERRAEAWSAKMHAAVDQDHLAGHGSGGQEIAQGRHDLVGIAGPA